MKRVYWALVGVCIFTINVHAAVVSSFLINSGNWSVDANWSNAPAIGGYPDNGNGGFAYNATVDSDATLDQNITIQKLNLNNGLITGGSFNLTENQLFTWTGGSITFGSTGTNFANGGLAVNGGVVLTRGAVVPLVSSTLTNGYIEMGGGAVISNTTGVVFDIQDDSSFEEISGYFINLGVLEKSGAGNNVSGQGVGISLIQAVLTNHNVVLVNVGTLSIVGGGYSNGSLTTAPPGCILFTGDYTLDGGTLSGGGTVEVNNGTYTIMLTNAVTATVATFLQSVSVMGGPGNLVSSGLYLWTGGTASGRGTNFANGPLAVNGMVTLNQRTLVPTASSTLTNGSISFESGGTISNATGVVFDIQDDSSLLSEGPGYFVNLGVLEKTGAGNDVSNEGVSNSLVSVVFTNSGTVIAQSGILEFTGGYFQTGGATEVDGGTLSSSTPFNIFGGSVIGNGTILGTVVNNGTVSPGLSGTVSLTIAGTLTNEAGATLLVELGGYTPGIGYGFLTVTNRAFLAGNLAVSFSNNYSFISTVTNGASFTVATCGTNFAGSFANVASGGTLATTDGFAQFTVTYAGSTNLILSHLQIVDSIGDGIPNWWRAQYFSGNGASTNGSSCATCDADGTGQNNLFKYVAGLDPTNSTSVLNVQVVPVAGQPNQKAIIYQPIVSGRTYTVQSATNLTGGVYVNLTDFSGPTTNGTQATVTDLNATSPQKYYRVDVTGP